MGHASIHICAINGATVKCTPPIDSPHAIDLKATQREILIVDEMLLYGVENTMM
jgi:hypothetical protein